MSSYCFRHQNYNGDQRQMCSQSFQNLLGIMKTYKSNRHTNKCRITTVISVTEEMCSVLKSVMGIADLVIARVIPQASPPVTGNPVN